MVLQSFFRSTSRIFKNNILSPTTLKHRQLVRIHTSPPWFHHDTTRQRKFVPNRRPETPFLVARLIVVTASRDYLRDHGDVQILLVLIAILMI